MMGRNSLELKRLMPAMVVLSLLVAASYGMFLVTEEPAIGATSVGTITVTDGTTSSFNNVNYLLDGDIVVAGTGSRVIFRNSTITLSQDVGIDGKFGGGDDHNYTIRIMGGGRLDLINTKLTTQTGQLNPYFKIHVTADGAGTLLTFEDSEVEGPGEIMITNGARLEAERSSFYELQDQSSLAYDIDGDGSTEDDVDFNNDGPLFTFTSGGKGLMIESELRDTLSFSTSSRDGFLAGNITVDGIGSNLTLINSFIDVDFESNTSTGSHNMLKVENGGIAHLVGVSVNMSASASAKHPAFNIMDASSKVVYYRWVGAQVLDGMGIQTQNQRVTIYRVEGNKDHRLMGYYLTSDILDYMGKTALNWNRTSSNGWAFIPVITDVITRSSMPNSDSYPDFKVTVSIGKETVGSSTRFNNYPTLPDMGDNENIFEKVMNGDTVSSKVISLLGGALEFKNYVVSPASSSYFSGMDIDLTINSPTSLKGTSAIIDGTFYPSYYAFDGHLIIRSGGHLVINDTTVVFLTDDSPAYVLIENGGILEMDNVSLMGHGNNDLFVYAMGPGTPTIDLDKGNVEIDHLVARDTALVEIECDLFNGSLNTVGSNVDVTISAGSVKADQVYAEDCMLRLDGSPIAVDDLELDGVDLYSYDSVFNVPLDIDNYALLTNVTFTGALPQGRSSWLEPIGSGVIARAWWVDALVQDSVDNPLPGSMINVDRVDGSVNIQVSSHQTDLNGMAKFSLVQEELRASGRTFLGNYRLTASFRGHQSNPKSTLITGSDVDAVITIPGGPNLVPQSLSVDGTLIDGFPVMLIGNISNIGEFDSGPFMVKMDVNGLNIGEVMVPGLAANTSTEVELEWMTVQGETEFTLMIDPLNVVSETDEEDNSFSQMNIIGIGPDYAVSIEAGLEDWAYSLEGEFDLLITNTGEEDPEENSFYVNITWTSGFQGGVIEEYLPFEYIEPGSSIRRTINWTPMVTGLVTISVEIFSKYDRTPINSFDTMVLSILSLPDLKVALNSFQVDAPIPVTINTTVNVMLTVENLGDLPAGDFMVRAYDGLKTPENMMGSEVLVNGLLQEESIDVSFRWSTGLPIGYHDIIIIIDPLNSVIEQNETNNEMKFKVMVDTPPDLTFTEDIGASPKVITEGKNMTFWATIKNVGRTKAIDALMHFSIDSDTNLVESRTIDLSPGQEMNISFGWTAEGLGLHTLFIVADYWDAIMEPDETNNLRSIDFEVISKPDLFMEDNDLRVETTEDIEIGDEVSIIAAIRNSGETDAYNVFIRFYDGDPALGGKIISWKETQPSVSLGLIPAGGLEWINVTWIPQTGGYHNIYVVLDLANAIDESDEENNKIFWPVYVQTLPDLVFSNLTLFQGDFEVDSAGIGKTLIVNATLDNQGDTDAPAFKVNFFNGDFENDPQALPLGSDVIYLDGKLKGNSKMFIEMPWRVGYPKGIRTIIVKTELIDGVEQNPNNNQISIPIEIFDIDDVPELLPLNDTLIISSGYAGIEIDEETHPFAFQGMNISLDLLISNIGGLSASNTTILFMASNTTDSWVEYSTEIPFIENNGTDFISGYWNLKDLGLNTLRIIVDPENGIREFDEGNNILTIQLDVREAPDLSVEVIREGKQFNDDTGQFDMTQGEEYEISFMIENLGNFSFGGLMVEYSGPVEAPTRYIDLAPYQTRKVTFTIKPEIDAGQVAVWKCRINDDGKFYESDEANNEASSVVNVMEPEPGSILWILFLVIILLILIALAIAGYYIYTKMKTKDMAKCSNCGGLVSIDETLCPHCGIEFSDELECECGEIIPMGATECPSCGRPVAGEPVGSLEEGEEIEEGEEEAEEDTEELEEVSEEQEAPEEMEDIEEVQEEAAPEAPGEEEELAECFECGALIPVSAPICPHCGAVFE